MPTLLACVWATPAPRPASQHAQPHALERAPAAPRSPGAAAPAAAWSAGTRPPPPPPWPSASRGTGSAPCGSSRWGRARARAQARGWLGQAVSHGTERPCRAPSSLHVRASCALLPPPPPHLRFLALMRSRCSSVSSFLPPPPPPPLPRRCCGARPTVAAAILPPPPPPLAVASLLSVCSGGMASPGPPAVSGTKPGSSGSVARSSKSPIPGAKPAAPLAPSDWSPLPAASRRAWWMGGRAHRVPGRRRRRRWHWRRRLRRRQRRRQPPQSVSAKLPFVRTCRTGLYPRGWILQQVIRPRLGRKQGFKVLAGQHGQPRLIQRHAGAICSCRSGWSENSGPLGEPGVRLREPAFSKPCGVSERLLGVLHCPDACGKPHRMPEQAAPQRAGVRSPPLSLRRTLSCLVPGASGAMQGLQLLRGTRNQM